MRVDNLLLAEDQYFVYFTKCYCTTDQQCVEGEVCLFSNQSNEEFVNGQVEICSSPHLGGFRTKVCDTNWDDQDAEVVCKELGLPHGRYCAAAQP